MKVNSGTNLRYSLKNKDISVVSLSERLFKDKVLYNLFKDALAFEIRIVIKDFKERDKNLKISEKNSMAISKKAANNFLIDWISGEEF